MNRELDKEYALSLVNKGILIKPVICPKCGKNKIIIHKYSKMQTTKLCFRCMRYKRKKIIPIRENSFFSYFAKISINECLEVIKCFFSLNINAKKAYTYLTQQKFLNISEQLIRNIYTKIRETLYYYYFIEYETEDFALENAHYHYSVDESLFYHDLNCKQIWVLGITENETKNFRVVVSYNRDEEMLKTFIKKFIPRGNIIISDAWLGYSFLNDVNSGYIHSIHVHGQNDFGFGLDSTSHVESIWGILKHELKSLYTTIRYHNFLYFLREIKFKYKYRALSNEKKIEKFFDCFYLIK